MIEPLSAIPNPFSDAAVGSVWDSGAVDVIRIHAGVTQALLQTIDERARGHHHRCIMLYGDAGSGKTHVMRRLRVTLANDETRIVPFSWVRMQASPSMMWRHVRRCFADDLARRPFRGGTQLGAILARNKDKLDAVENRDLAIVLEHLAEGRHRRDARAWLAGSSLPDAVLGAMGIAVPDNEEEAFEDESRRIVYALAEFIAPSPAVLCLDQLEALQSHPGDKNGLFAIGKLLASLHDDVRNMVVIGCVQSGLISVLASTLSKAEQDRYQPKGLLPLDAADVRALVRARLDASPQLARVRPTGVSEFWPLDINRLDPLVSSREGVSARKVIFECEQMFRAAQHLPADATPLDERLSDKFEERLRQARVELSADSSSPILSDALPRLLHLRGSRILRADLPKWMDHVSVRPDGRQSGVVLANDDPRVLWRKLDRVLREWNPAERGLVVVRDAMNPLSAAAHGSQRRLAELERRGARIVSPSREALAALDAARRLLADVESGDLTYRGEKVAVNTVEDWVRSHLSEPGSRFLDDLGSPQRTQPSPQRILAIAACLAEKKIATLPELAECSGSTLQEIEDCARQNPDQFGFLAGSEPVVFERIPEQPGA